MRIFELNANLKSYTYPTIKIVVALAIIIICIFRDHIIQVKSDSIIITIICGIIAVLCILCIYISVEEIFHAYENRTAECNKMIDVKTFSANEYSVDDIVALTEKNDIIDIEVVYKDNIVKIGSSSDCKNSDSKFFDKLYYIDDVNYASIGEFESALIPLSEDGTILSVISIDGLRTK